MRGGSITLTCGDSAYRIGSTLISEPVVDDEATAPGQRNDDPDGQDLFHQGTSDGKDGGYGLSRVSGDPSSSPGGIFSMKAVSGVASSLASGFRLTVPKVKDTASDVGLDGGSDKKGQMPTSPGFGLPKGKRRQTASDLIHTDFFGHVKTRQRSSLEHTPSNLYQQAKTRESFHSWVGGLPNGCAISGCVVIFLELSMYSTCTSRIRGYLH